MADDVERLRMRRAVHGLAPTGEFVPWSSAAALAPMMLAAYRGTPDDEGETLEDTIEVLEQAMLGEWGPWLQNASFVAIDAGVAVGALLSAMYGDVPFISFVFTAPDRAGTGVATRLIAKACEALAQQGYATVDLWVNPASVRAVRLYRHLGFVEV